jgi:hypothetical protein
MSEKENDNDWGNRGATHSKSKQSKQRKKATKASLAYMALFSPNSKSFSFSSRSDENNQ